MLRAAPTWSQGKWTVSTSPTFFRQRTEGKSSLERRQLAGPPDGTTNRDERGTSETRGRGVAQRTQVVYRPDQKRSFAAAFATSSFRRVSETDNDVTASDGSFAPFAQDIFNRFTVKAGNLALDYRAEGNLPGELLTVAASGSTYTLNGDVNYRETAQNGAAVALISDTRITDRTGQLKADYATPLGKTKRLSLGASIDLNRRQLADRTFGGSLIGPARNSLSDFGGEYRELAAYATFQAQFGDWKLLPGLRVQSRDYSLDDLNGDGPSRTDLFPSLFVERKLGKAWTGVLSYSRRIAWPDVGDLTPVFRYLSPTAAFSGNPDLEPETTDSFEARVSRVGKVHSFDLTAYHRITHDTFDRAVTLQPDGLLLSIPVNAGRKLDQGLEAAFRGRALPSLRYTLTGNLTSIDRSVGVIGNRDRSTQYRGKLQLDYNQGKGADPGYDQLTLNLRYEGPVQLFQTERSDFIDADLTWTHRFTPKLALVTSVFALFGGADVVSTTRTPFFSERRRDEPAGRTFRVTLTYQLGDKPQPLPPQQPAGPMVPGM